MGTASKTSEYSRFSTTQLRSSIHLRAEIGSRRGYTTPVRLGIAKPIRTVARLDNPYGRVQNSDDVIVIAQVPASRRAGRCGPPQCIDHVSFDGHAG